MNVRGILVLLLMFAMLMVGCGNATSDNTTDQEITLYAITDGGTSFYLKPVTRVVHFDKEMTVTQKMKAVLQMLTEDIPSTATVWMPLPHDAKVLYVKVKGDVAWVNFDEGILHNPGAGAESEMLALCSIPLTLKQFGVNKVYILINGQTPSEDNGYIDFWGHVGLYDQPLTATQCLDMR